MATKNITDENFETEVLNEIRSSHGDLLDAIANEKELSKENDDKLKSISSYKVSELQDLIGKLKLKVEGKSKQKLYDEIQELL